MDAHEVFRELISTGGNAFAVGANVRGQVSILNPPTGAPISKRAAANLAAWLIMTAGLELGDLAEVMAPQGVTF